MNSINLVLTLVFSVVMLLFVSYPAMRISEWLEKRFLLNHQWHTLRVILLTILFSLIIGLYLRFG